jgi:hypothetical protein
MAPATGAAPTNVQGENTRAALATLAFVGFAGLLRRRRVEAWLFAPALLVYPIVYYITFPDARYRHPIEPLMLMLAVYTVGKSLETRVRASQK